MSYESVMNADLDSMTEVQRQILEVSDADAQVLEFSLGGERYCVDIEPVSEVLWNEHATADVPNLDPHVVGVSNLRGRSVEIIDPKRLLDETSNGEEENVILFEGTDGNERGTAWLVDAVHQVLSVSEDEIDESASDENIRGLIERDNSLIIWVSQNCFDEYETDVTEEVTNP